MSGPTTGQKPRIIWEKSGNPTHHVSDVLNIERWQLRVALHKIKSDANLAPTDKVIIWSDGKVTDTGGEVIGDIHGEI